MAILKDPNSNSLHFVRGHLLLKKKNNTMFFDARRHPWTPSQIHVDSTDNLIGWYDPNDANSLTLDSNNRAITVASQNGQYPLSPDNSGPVIGARQVYDKNVFDFDGAANLVNNSIPTATFGFYTILSFDIDATEEVQEFIFDSDNNDSERVFLRRINGVLGAQPGGSTTETYPESNEHCYILSFVSDQESDIFKLRINGVDVIDSTSNTGTRNGTGLKIASQFSPGAFLDGFMSDIVIVQDVSHTEKIEGFLAHKWGLQSQLDPAHTYYSERPEL